MAYNSKYTGAQVENLLDQVANGGGGTSGYAGMPVVEVGYQDATTYILQPNTYYKQTGTLDGVDFILGDVIEDTKVNEYLLEINDSSRVIDITFPSTIVWANGEAPTFVNPTVVSIINGLGVWAEFTA